MTPSPGAPEDLLAPPTDFDGPPLDQADVILRSDADPGLRLTAYLFQHLFASRPTVVTAGPGGLSLFGRPGDRFGLAIPMRWGATVAAAARDDGLVDLRSGSEIGKEVVRPLGTLDDLPDWAVRPLAPVASVLAAGHPLGGMSVLVGTALPGGAGMQPDVALTCAMASILAHLFGAELSWEERAGLGDVAAQMAALSCPDGTAMLVDTERMTAELLPFDLVGAGLRMMFVDLGPSVESVAAGEPELALIAAEHLRSGDVHGLGALLGWGTEPPGDGPDPGGELAAVTDAACRAGALGVGTLPGGCLMALVPASGLRPVRAAVTAAWTGGRVPKFLTAVSSRGGVALTA